MALGLAPATLVLLATVGYPLVATFWLSLRSWNLLTNQTSFVGLENYAAQLTDPDTLNSVFVTIAYSGGGLLLQTVLGLGLALALRSVLLRRLPATGALRVVILAPMVVAPLLWAFYFRSFFSPGFGLFNGILKTVGLPTPTWANSPDTALLSLVLADTWQWAPFMASLLLAALLSLPREVLEAAAIDGAGRLRTLVTIELPLIAKLMVVAMLLRLIDSIKNVELMFVITQGGPGTATETLNYDAYQLGFIQFQMGLSATMAVVVFAVTMTATMFLIRVLRSSGGA